VADGNQGSAEELLPASPNTPEEDARENKKKARLELLIVGVILFLIFVVFLPQFIDYGDVIDAMRQLTAGEIVLLLILGVAKTWFDAGVYNTLIPGLKWWDGWKAWASSNSVAFVAPPGADLAIRFGMYRTAGITGESASAGIVLSWFFSTGYKLVVPIIAFAWVVIAEGVTDPAVVTLTVIGLAAVIGGVGLLTLILYRERVALWVGEIAQRWYNGLAGGRWKFPEAAGLGIKLVDFRGQVIGTLKARWLPATVTTLTAQAIFFVILVMSMRFVGVTSAEAPVAIIFDAYAVGLLLSMIPIFPGGIGVVELAYVLVIVGNSGDSDLANAVMAGAFVHRIFTWLVPILVGLIPLAAWRRNMRKSKEGEAASKDATAEEGATPA
jgi:uncharacterized membrane protein YbhN (UPF0104 family)